MNQEMSVVEPPKSWRGWWGLALTVCLLIGLARWGDAWADRQLGVSVHRATAAFLVVRGLEAGLDELQSMKTGAGLGVISGEVAPFAWLHPVAEMAERAGSLLFAGLVVLEGLRLLGELMSSWAVDALLVASAFAVAGIARPWPVMAGVLWPVLRMVLVFRLALVVCALAVWPAEEMLQHRVDSVRQRIEGLSLPSWRQVGVDKALTPSWWPSSKKESADPPDPRATLRGVLDGLAADLVAMAAALAFELIVLPVLALMLLRGVVAGGLSPRQPSA